MFFKEKEEKPDVSVIGMQKIAFQMQEDKASNLHASAIHYLAPFNCSKQHAQYPVILSVQACAEVASKRFGDSTAVLTTISYSP